MHLTPGVLRVVPMLLLAACASGGATVGAVGERSEDAAAPRPRPSAGLNGPITAADIARVNAASAYDAVVKLRANFLRSRGVSSFMQPVRSSHPIVFIDGMEIGTLFELRSLPAAEVAEIRFLSSGEATIRYGDGYMAGVILVTTKR